MNLKDYVADKKYLLLFYFTLITFISSIIYLDGNVKVRPENILYINSVSLVFLFIYILGGYFFHKKYYSCLLGIIENRGEDIVNRLPKYRTNEQKLYNHLIKSVYLQQNEKIDGLYEEKKETQEFIAFWAHQIKTPIAASKLVIEDSTGKNTAEVLDSLEEEIDKIESHVEHALYFSKIDDFSRDYFITETDVGKLARDTVKKHAKTFIARHISIEMEAFSLNTSTDRKWLMYIIDQIMSNSLKYTRMYGKVKIMFEEDVNEKRLLIEDNGIGINPEDMERVFNRGFTGFNGREFQKSTGMGLYLAKRLARKLGHDISIESVRGEFTRVTIHFPRLSDYMNVVKN